MKLHASLWNCIYFKTVYLFANIGKEQDTPREGCLHVSHFRSYFLTTKTEDKAVLVDNKQLQGSSTFDFNWVFEKATFTGTLALQKYQSAKPSKNLFKFLI